jgi:hypothetical protein
MNFTVRCLLAAFKLEFLAGAFIRKEHVCYIFSKKRIRLFFYNGSQEIE